MYALRWFFIVLLCSMTFLPASRGPAGGDSVAFEKRWIGGARLYVIRADLNDPRVKVDIGIPARGIPGSESFYRMIMRHAPVAAVTGTYFDIRSLFPVGTLVIGGKVAHKNYIGTAVCFARPGADRRAYCVTFTNVRPGRDYDWTGTECGLRTGPRLLAGGAYVLNPRREGFRYAGLFGCRTRMALGVTRYNKLLLVSVRTPVTFARCASIMKLLGAVDAVCLDGGTSSAMYYRGRFVCLPGRALTNIIEIHRVPVAAEPTYGQVLQPTKEEPAKNVPELSRPEKAQYDLFTTYDHFAVILDPITLRPSKSRHPIFPIDRAKLSRL